jgi:ABC-type glycerol-3-phosphate transport system substrate-binding protein
MKRIAVILALVVMTLGLVACGSGSSSTGSDAGGSVDPAEVAKGVALYHEWKRLQGLSRRGIHRMAMAMEYGTKQEVASLEVVEDEIRAEIEQVVAEAEEQSKPVKRAVTKQLEEEEEK